MLAHVRVDPCGRLDVDSIGAHLQRNNALAARRILLDERRIHLPDKDRNRVHYHRLVCIEEGFADGQNAPDVLPVDEIRDPDLVDGRELDLRPGHLEFTGFVERAVREKMPEREIAVPVPRDRAVRVAQVYRPSVGDIESRLYQMQRLTLARRYRGEDRAGCSASAHARSTIETEKSLKKGGRDANSIKSLSAATGQP